ncbi:hypothetical protein HHK36_027691 [Tetracentron sinense]|uniref:BAHD acyltransferase n=1 Tax=Tetracentron sinense TaxID=13715 RepID=A0A834YFA2_TETSI|nr:hypothetical protein HHK36_027691 [Tetracentron sinense]
MATENGKKEMVNMRVKVIGKTTVFSSEKFGRRECPLVTFDLPYLTFFYNQKVLLYKGGVFEEMVENLKEGLRVVLGEFYPLVGRLGQDEEGVLRVVCDDAYGGVEVSEAVAEDVDVAELAEDETSSILKEIVPYTGILNLEGLHRPLLAVQFTKLRDGMAIGCAFNHAILDGNSTWHFMSSWAEICRGSTTISVLPFHDRTKARNTRVKLELPKSAAEFKRLTQSNGETKVVPRFREKIFRFSESAIDKIKSDVNSNLSNGSKPFSTFQSLGAHIWMAITRARRLKPEDYTVFTVFTDCRKRVDPKMPDNYFGNLIQAVFTVLPAGVLLANPPEFGASMLQKVIGMHDAKAIDDRSKEWESAPKLFQYEDAGGNCVAVGSSPRFRVYDVDFGWGKPEAVRSGSNNRFDGMVYLYQAKSGGRNIDVEVSLEAGAMENLEKDQEFLMEV